MEDLAARLANLIKASQPKIDYVEKNPRTGGTYLQITQGKRSLKVVLNDNQVANRVNSYF